MNVGEDEDVLAESFVCVAVESDRTQSPLDTRQWRAGSRACDVGVAAWYHLHGLGFFGEEGRDASHCKSEGRRMKRDAIRNVAV